MARFGDEEQVKRTGSAIAAAAAAVAVVLPGTAALAESPHPPPAVVDLCTNQGQRDFSTEDGQTHTFHGNAPAVLRCEGDAVWAAGEDGAKVNDAAVFYFDANGMLLNICQPLLWRSGCETFGKIACEEDNYCRR